MDIERLGFDHWYQDRIDPGKLTDHHIARVIAVNKNSSIIHNGRNDIPAEITGKLMFDADSPLDYPTVGDWVYVQIVNDQSFAVIHRILPRKSILKRKTAGKRVEFQLIAANIDTAFIMQSLDSDFNIRRLERYLVMIHESDIHPVLLLSKSDLVPSADISKRIAEIHQAAPGILILAFSNNDDSSLNRVKELLICGQTYCLLGSSGVGKTTLINNLLGEALFETKTVRRKDGKGRHVTARRQLILLENGAMIIDTPGMRELGNIAAGSGLSDTFSEITELSERCRYRNCTHTSEAGCAVLAAVENGIVSQERHRNYIRMKKESDYYALSYMERRQRDKQFGKFIKSAMKNVRGKRYRPPRTCGQR